MRKARLVAALLLAVVLRPLFLQAVPHHLRWSLGLCWHRSSSSVRPHGKPCAPPCMQLCSSRRVLLKQVLGVGRERQGWVEQVQVRLVVQLPHSSSSSRHIQ